jgi:hypothetical protein
MGSLRDDLFHAVTCFARASVTAARTSAAVARSTPARGARQFPVERAYQRALVRGIDPGTTDNSR